TIVFVSHDTASVINLCQRAIWLDKGRIQQIGTAKEVSESYLGAFFEAQQGASNLGDKDKSEDRKQSGSGRLLTDQRLNFINQSGLRNDIELFHFDTNGTAFGKGGGKITQIELTDENGNPYSWVVGGERVCLRVRAEALYDIHSPILGFYIKDKLGQTLFGDNTYLTYVRKPQIIFAGEGMEARFVFQMPILPVGEYTIAAALASGNQAEHVHHHWIHDAMVLKSHSSSTSMGLVGIPMLEIGFDKFSDNEGRLR
ncbi:Wzt carbohydrate-binding domain-containing protein, partial [Candidatus Methylomirabilis sp.]|uniref:Wzt carbohydrate-binding domain-containing protein n=1 Tax=Candidatus Methylomirabilis sp. TaxID=2032687 RepID=UPI003C73583F